METQSDRQLVARMLGGNEQAFDEFFDRFFAPVYRFVLSRTGGDDDVAEEVTQATLIAAIRGVSRWRGEASLLTWIFTIARRKLSATIAESNREPAHVLLAEELPEIRAALESLSSAESDPEAVVRRKEVAGLVQSALDLLPAHYGSALEWKYVFGLSVEEIAARLGVGPKAAESILTRARAAFRDAFATLGRTRELDRWSTT